MEYQLAQIQDHLRGKVYEIQANGKNISVLLTHHVLNRLKSFLLP